MGKRTTRHQGHQSAGPRTVKVTLTFDVELARRLAVLSANRRVTQSSIAAEILGPALKGVRLIDLVGTTATTGAEGEG